MANLTEQQLEDIKSHMLHQEEALKTKFKAKNTEYITIKVLHNEVEDYEKKGYSEVSRTSKKTTMNLKKDSGSQFEDDIWCMFYRLGFRVLNADENLRIQWGPNKEDTQQLDVVAVGEDAIFVVECKSTATPKPGNFKKELNGIEQYKNGVADVLKQIYGKKKRVKFIFATRNYRFQEEGEDILRMKQNGIFHLNDNSYNYITNLIRSYKEAVQYQFHALMFKDELINDDKIIIPALKGEMGGRTYYLFSIEPSKLLKVGFVLHRTKVNDSMAPTYQRLLVPSRLKGITKFINDGGYFPNSIIINFGVEDNGLDLHFTSTPVRTDSNAEFGFLYIPNAYGFAHIIDGQHRVYGYANSDHKDDNTIPVVAFENMLSEEQLKIFMDINENQKAVSKNLRIDLEQDLLWDAKRPDSRMKALRSSIIKELSGSSNHILYNLISIGEDPAKLSSAPFNNALQRSGLIPKANASQWTGNTDTCIYNINECDTEKAMRDSRKRITQFIDGAYNLIYDFLDEEKRNDFLLTNRGTFAFITLIGSLHTHLMKSDEFSFDSSINIRLDKLRPYLETLANALNNISDEESANLKGALGSGADPFWLHSFQNMVYKKFNDYCPDELKEWQETQDKDVQKEGNDLKVEIRELLKKSVFDKLKYVFGVKWENQVTKYKLECQNKIYSAYGDDDDFDMDNHDWKDWLEITDYKDIISKNFANEEFSTLFSINVGLAFKTKKDKLAWLSMVEQQKGKKAIAMTRSDLNRLWIIREQLHNFVGDDNV